jgi:hypothetical protein
MDVSEAVVLLVLPMFNNVAFMGQLVIISRGVQAVIMSKFEEELFLRSIQKYKVRIQ